MQRYDFSSFPKIFKHQNSCFPKIFTFSTITFFEVALHVVAAQLKDGLYFSLYVEDAAHCCLVGMAAVFVEMRIACI